MVTDKIILGHVMYCVLYDSELWTNLANGWLFWVVGPRRYFFILKLYLRFQTINNFKKKNQTVVSVSKTKVIGEDKLGWRKREHVVQSE